MVDEKGNVKYMGAGKWWLVTRGAGSTSALLMSPAAATPTRSIYGAASAASRPRATASLYQAPARECVCATIEHFNYLMNWMARAVQQPGTQGEVAVVIRGKEGTGKGIAIGQFGKLFGAHYLQVSQPRHLVGNFNGPLQAVSVLFADEAFFAGDRSHEGVLKALVTEPTLQIEIKGVEPITARNSLHIMMSSNSDWVVPAGADARRFFCLNVCATHKQDTRYFEPLVRQMDSGGRAALLHDLLERDISAFNVRQVPATEMLRSSKATRGGGLTRSHSYWRTAANCLAR